MNELERAQLKSKALLDRVVTTENDNANLRVDITDALSRLEESARQIEELTQELEELRKRVQLDEEVPTVDYSDTEPDTEGTSD